MKQQLDPSHEELQREEFLASWEYCKDQRGKWTGSIRWWPGDKWFYDQEERRNRKELAQRIEAPKVLPVLAPPVEALSSLSSEVVQDEAAVASERYARVVERFYARLGQTRISRQKREQGIDILTDLEIQGFSGEEIEVGLEWILRNKDQLGGKVYSLGLLPKVIGQALEGKGRTRKREEGAQKVREAELDSAQDEKRRRRLTEIYDALSAGKREALTAKARENLLQQGFKQEFLLDALVRAEVLRLIGEEYGGIEE